MASPLLREAAAAELLDVPRRTLSQWRYLGRGPAFIKLGGQVRYRLADLETWLTDNTVQPGSRVAP